MTRIKFISKSFKASWDSFSRLQPRSLVFPTSLSNFQKVNSIGSSSLRWASFYWIIRTWRQRTHQFCSRLNLGNGCRRKRFWSVRKKTVMRTMAKWGEVEGIKKGTFHFHCKIFANLDCTQGKKKPGTKVSDLNKYIASDFWLEDWIWISEWFCEEDLYRGISRFNRPAALGIHWSIFPPFFLWT